ncbi:MAG: hypothetical protein J7559_21950, partial [Cohnella sp.]|nr:hypothetical protein [Cohnella sp.]
GLERKLRRLSELVDQLETSNPQPAIDPEIWYRVGKEMNRFAADYFIHLEREEGPGMKALWENLTDEQLKLISVRIRSSIPPQAMAIFMHYMIPAIGHQERVAILSDIKKFAPREAYEGMSRLAQSRLDEASWTRLHAALEEVTI